MSAKVCHQRWLSQNFIVLVSCCQWPKAVLNCLVMRTFVNRKHENLSHLYHPSIPYDVNAAASVVFVWGHFNMDNLCQDNIKHISFSVNSTFCCRYRCQVAESELAFAPSGIFNSLIAKNNFSISKFDLFLFSLWSSQTGQVGKQRAVCSLLTSPHWIHLYWIFSQL